MDYTLARWVQSTPAPSVCEGPFKLLGLSDPLAHHFLDALIGWVRSTGPRLWTEGIRVNAICPGVVETPIIDNPAFESLFPREMWIDIQLVTGTVLNLLSGTEMVDGKGTLVKGDEMHSRALHISGKTFFFIEMPDFHDEASPLTWNAMMYGSLNL